jgi:DNA (cytosine-5)-methyltransferase 1
MSGDTAITIGSLFSGIGGLELGIEAGLAVAGYPSRTIWQVEKNEYCRAVLARHWPHAQRYTDVTTLDTSSVPTPSIVCGGWPCQDISLAGKGAGIHGARSGLFYEMARIVRQLRPRIWVLENVPAINHRGLSDVLGEVASIGYAARWGGLRASEVGAPHRRERWFCVCWLADPDSKRGDPSSWVATVERADLSDPDRRGWRCPSMADTKREQQEGRSPPGRMGRDKQPIQGHGDRKATAESGMGRGFNGLSSRLDGHRWPAPPGPTQHDYEPPRTRPRQPDDEERLKALGNAVVPQQAAVIGRWVGEYLLGYGGRGQP